MSTITQFAEVAALAGDPARASILHALMDGCALTATELATLAGIAPQTASGHLQRLAETGLITVTPQGRHRYHRLASTSVAEMMEAIMRVASDETAERRKPVRVGPRDQQLRRARTCYDHLAGELGVALTEALVRGGHLQLDSDAGTLTESGVDFLASNGIPREALVPVSASLRNSRAFCRPCLDWSERRFHLAGRAGAAICSRSFEAGWLRRIPSTRAVAITPKGEQKFHETFGIRFS